MQKIWVFNARLPVEAGRADQVGRKGALDLGELVRIAAGRPGKRPQIAGRTPAVVHFQGVKHRFACVHGLILQFAILHRQALRCSERCRISFEASCGKGSARRALAVSGEQLRAGDQPPDATIIPHSGLPNQVPGGLPENLIFGRKSRACVASGHGA